MEYQTTQVVHELTIRIDVQDVPTMTRKYRKTTVQPMSVRITAVDGEAKWAHVQGRRVLQSGGLGVDVFEDGWTCGSRYDDMPEWLQDIVARVTQETIIPSWLAHSGAPGASK